MLSKVFKKKCSKVKYFSSLIYRERFNRYEHMHSHISCRPNEMIACSYNVSTTIWKRRFSVGIKSVVVFQLSVDTFLVFPGFFKIILHVSAERSLCTIMVLKMMSFTLCLQTLTAHFSYWLAFDGKTCQQLLLRAEWCTLGAVERFIKLFWKSIVYRVYANEKNEIRINNYIN